MLRQAICISGMLLLMSCGNGTGGGYVSPLDALIQQDEGEINTALIQYRNSPTCNDPSILTVTGMTAVIGSDPEAYNSGTFQTTLNNRLFSADALNRLAGAAMAKGCREVARDTYLSVITEYTGTAYAALRQRAQIGLDDLRAAPASVTPAPKSPRPVKS